MKNPGALLSERPLVGRLCQLRKLSEFTEWSRGDAGDIDGQAARARERERASQTPYKITTVLRSARRLRPRL